MKKILFVILGFVSGFAAQAGEGDTYFSFSGGALYKNAISSEFTFEKEISHHGGWEVGLDYYNNCFGKIERDSNGIKIQHHAILFQGAYKRVLIRYKNSNIRWRIAAGAGVNEKGFTCSVTPGLEYNHTFSNGIQFFILDKNQFSFWSSNKSWFRTGLLVGIKIPF